MFREWLIFPPLICHTHPLSHKGQVDITKPYLGVCDREIVLGGGGKEITRENIDVAVLTEKTVKKKISAAGDLSENLCCVIIFCKRSDVQ